MKTFFLTLIFVMCGFASFSQLENIPLVTVIGEATENIIPDQIILKVTIDKPQVLSQLQSSNASMLFSNDNSQIRFIENEAQLLTEGYPIIKSVKEDKLVKEFYITVNDASKYTDILYKLLKSGFDRIEIWDIRSTKLDAIKLSVFAGAVANARNKALKMVGPLGQQIGKAHLVEELPQSIFNGYAQYLLMPYDSLDRANNNSYMVQPLAITVTSKVRVSFDLIK